MNTNVVLSKNIGQWHVVNGWEPASGYLGSASIINSNFTNGIFKSYLYQSNIYINITSAGGNINDDGMYDFVSLKVYEDDVKIPSLITNRNKDCLGNILTTDLL